MAGHFKARVNYRTLLKDTYMTEQNDHEWLLTVLGCSGSCSGGLR